MLGRLLAPSALVALLTLSATRAANAQEAQVSDAGATSTSAAEAAPQPVSWHGSTLLWYQRVGTQTLGVGADYQSRNPYYDTVLYFRPRYYLWERAPSSLSIRGQFAGSYEITNSDTTTKRGEVLLEDSVLALVPEHTFGDGEDATLVSVSVPRLTLPTSYAARKSGKIVEVGARAVIDHGVPLRTTSKVLPRGRLAARLGYAYGFVSGTVPTADTLSRLRRDLDGHTVRNGQIGGAAFADHTAVLRGIVGADVYSDLLSFAFELGVDPAHKRKLPAPLVRGLDTGDYLARSTENPTRWPVTTYLDTAFIFHIEQMLDLYVGYENITAQMREDGRRRNVLYSPDAKFYLAAELTLDKAYEAASGSSQNVRKAAARSP